MRSCVECRNDFLCEGWFVIDRRQMVLWVFVPRDAADLMLDAVKTAARLLADVDAENSDGVFALARHGGLLTAFTPLDTGYCEEHRRSMPLAAIGTVGWWAVEQARSSW